MNLSLPRAELISFIARQLNHIIPDGRDVTSQALSPAVDRALGRTERCFSKITHPSYGDGSQVRFNHLHSDQYCQFLYLLSREVYLSEGNTELAQKLFCLNKALHSFNCMYDTELPEFFWLIHVVGAVLGKAKYSNFLVVRQNCTVGAIAGDYPELGEGLILSAGASIVGRCRIGRNVMVGPGCCLVNREVADNVFITNEPVWRERPNGEKALRVHFR